MVANLPPPETPRTDDENPFAEMGFIKFWLVSTVFYLTFPLSMLLSLVVLGTTRTKQLVRSLVHDFLQTLFVLIALLALVGWAIYHYVGGLFAG